jgi:hypothetical protein
MAESKTIRVTPNVKKCLEVLKKAVASMPAGLRREQAQDALSYLAKTFAGKRQPRGGSGCPVDTGIIK